MDDSHAPDDREARRSAPGDGSSHAVHVLWTGGWDSTYRVLDLILVHEADVQPHYVIVPVRQNALPELRSMQEIKRKLTKQDESAASRLRPCRITLLEDIEPNAMIESQWKGLAARRTVDSQYDWLNRYRLQHGLVDLEIGFQKDDNAPHFELLRRYAVESVAADGSPSWRLPEGFSHPDLILYDRFTYPLLWLRKEEMRQRAKAGGFLDLLELSWFCQLPVGASPCGYCQTCRSTMKAGGMEHRFPRISRFRHKAWRVFYLLRLLREYPGALADRLVHPLVRPW